MIASKKRRRLIIACLNGAAASSRPWKRRFFSDVIIEQMKTIYDRNDERDGIFVDGRYAKGGAIRTGKRKIRRFILDNNKPENVLLLCGKSYGGRNAASLLRELKPRLKYRAIHLILVDACWIGRLFNRRLLIKVPQVDAIKNYFQHNNVLLNGARIDRKNLIGGSCVEWDLSKYMVCGEPVNHWSIIHHDAVKVSISHSIQRLFGVLRSG